MYKFSDAQGLDAADGHAGPVEGFQFVLYPSLGLVCGLLGVAALGVGYMALKREYEARNLRGV